MKLNNYYQLNELEQIILQLIDTNKVIIYFSLYDMIDTKRLFGINIKQVVIL